LGVTTGTIAEKVAPAARISILECFGLEKRLSAGLLHMVKAMEFKLVDKPSEGAVYNLYCLILSQLASQNQKIPGDMTYGMFCKLYKVDGCQEELPSE